MYTSPKVALQLCRAAMTQQHQSCNILPDVSAQVMVNMRIRLWAEQPSGGNI